MEKTLPEKVKNNKSFFWTKIKESLEDVASAIQPTRQDGKVSNDELINNMIEI